MRMSRFFPWRRSSVAARAPRRYPFDVAERVAMTVSCQDCASVPKVPSAGTVVDRHGRAVQIMHDGTLVLAGGYCGDWMTEIIRELHGHHEPQEELAFHHLLRHCRPATRIVEIGANWAYYTNWYLGAVPGSDAVCVEPDARCIAVGTTNLELNGRVARWVQSTVGRSHVASTLFRQLPDGATINVPCHSLDSLLDIVGRRPVEMLHIDCQGAELPFLESMDRAGEDRLLRFVVASTHHASISGVPTTHRDCLRKLESLGAAILCEHAVEESFSGDGLIVASLLPADAAIPFPAISRNTPAESLFGPPA